MNYDKILSNILFGKRSTKYSLVKKILNNEYPNILNYILLRYNDSESFDESLKRIKYNIENRPVCQICGGKTIYRGIQRTMYSLCCNNTECQKKLNLLNRTETSINKYGVDNPAKADIIKDKIKETRKTLNENEILEKRKLTNIRKFGVDNPYKSKEIISKIKETKLENYGDENYNNVDKAKETCLERYGVKAGWNTETTKQTLIEKYGVDNPAKADAVKEKMQETCLEKYGTKYAIAADTTREKIIDSLIKHYGVDTIFKLEEFKEHIKLLNLERYGVEYYTQTDTFKQFMSEYMKYQMTEGDLLEKIKSSNVKKYGVEYFTQTQQFKEFMSKLTSSEEFQRQHLEAMKANWTIGIQISKPEREFYNLLIKKYPLAVQQYRSKEYPFTCDIYIPEINTYVECNYYWTHGGKPYEGTEEDLKIVEFWKSKNTKFYNNAINNWTVRDVKKRTIAKQNNVNLIEFWTLKESIEWLNNL